MVLEHVLAKVKFGVVTLVAVVNGAVICHLVVAVFGPPLVLLQVYIQATLGSELSIAI